MVGGEVRLRTCVKEYDMNENLVDSDTILNLLGSVNPNILAKMAQEINSEQAQPQNTAEQVPGAGMGGTGAMSPADRTNLERRSGYNGVSIPMQRMRSRLYGGTTNPR